MHNENEEVHLDAQEASGGTKTGAMRYVLIISMVLVIAIFAILFLRPFG